MRIITDLPREYPLALSPFNDREAPTKRIRYGLENVLNLYTRLAINHARETENNILNYRVDSVQVVGSAARMNRADSDLDFLLLVPDLDENTARNLRVMLSFVFFTDRAKQEAIDIFIRQKDIYPERPSVDISKFRTIRELIDKYNSLLH